MRLASACDVGWGSGVFQNEVMKKGGEWQEEYGEEDASVVAAHPPTYPYATKKRQGTLLARKLSFS